MDKIQAATLQAVRNLQRHPGNPWKEELRELEVRAEAGEDVRSDVIDLLRPNENARNWMEKQTESNEGVFYRRVPGYQQLPGELMTVPSSSTWACPRPGCIESLPVIMEGEDPPTCKMHNVPMRRRKKGRE